MLIRPSFKMPNADRVPGARISPSFRVMANGQVTISTALRYQWERLDEKVIEFRRDGRRILIVPFHPPCEWNPNASVIILIEPRFCFSINRAIRAIGVDPAALARKSFDVHYDESKKYWWFEMSA